MIYSQQGKLEEALAGVQQLKDLIPSCRASGDNSDGSKTNNSLMLLSDDDVVAVYVLHATILANLKRLKEANKVLSEAKMIYAGACLTARMCMCILRVY